MTPPSIRATNVEVDDEFISLDLDDGRSICLLIDWFPRLREGSPDARRNFQIIGKGIGIHWPDLDEDLSVHGLLDFLDRCDSYMLERRRRL